MNSLLLAVLTFVALAQARDLSQYTPKSLSVWPKIFPEDVNPRIVNGYEAEPHQFPYQVALFIDGRSFCGGSILSANTILTAAHCADGARSIEVVAGAHSIHAEEESQQSITSTNFIVHEHWDPFKIANDIALIILPASLNVDGETIASVKLYRGGDSLENENATVSGWGRPSDSSNAISPVLRHVSDTIISNTDCEKFYDVVQPSNVCLNGENGRSSCNGDSGGPLVINLNGEVQEAGIVSFGSAFGCEIGFPSAYTRVSSFIQWIEENSSSL